MEKANKGCVRRGKTPRGYSAPPAGRLVIPRGEVHLAARFSRRAYSRHSEDFQGVRKIRNKYAGQLVRRKTYFVVYLIAGFLSHGRKKNLCDKKTGEK